MRRTVEVQYIEYWVVRVIKDSITSKTVVKEIPFETPPTEQDVIDILLNTNADEFISIAHNYRMKRN